eukprot:5534491-Prymnesium_polylepis.2
MPSRVASSTSSRHQLQRKQRRDKRVRIRCEHGVSAVCARKRPVSVWSNARRLRTAQRALGG